jgi:hypothetical protein
VHGPFWQTTPFSIPIGDTKYRGSFIRIYAEDGLWKSLPWSNTTDLPPNAPPGGLAECTRFNEISAVPDDSKCFAKQFAIVDKAGTDLSDSVDATVAGASTVDVLSGFIGNIAQANTGTPQGQPDTLRVFEALGQVNLTQLHSPTPPSPFRLGPLKGESWTTGCVSWTANYLIKDVYTTSDVQLLDPVQTKNARCFITGVTGAWSSTRKMATEQPYAQIYFGASQETRLHVSPTAGEDRVGAFASCIQLK